jgi:integrase
MKIYRVTPKNNKWIVQRIDDRSTASPHPFLKKSEAENCMFQLMAAEKKSTIQEEQGGETVVEAFKEFAGWKVNQSDEDNRITDHSMKRYDTEYRLRISKYMDHKVLLSNFNIKDMEKYLDKCKAAKVPFKTMRKSVKDIKHFLRRMKAIGKDPRMDNENFDILTYHKVIPHDDDLIYKKEVELIGDNQIKDILNKLYEEFNTDRNAANAFGIFCMLFLFGLRASELAGLKKDCVDFDNEELVIKGTWINQTYYNRTKNRGSRRRIAMDENSIKFLKVWMEYLEKNNKYSTWLFPGLKGDGPLSYKYINATVWKVYAKMGLADITVRRDGHVVINSSPLKGHPTKIFRHRLASHLISAMNANPLLDQNRVKTFLGHTQFSTTEGIYGNKLIDKDRKKLADAKAAANNNSLIPNFSKNN